MGIWSILKSVGGFLTPALTKFLGRSRLWAMFAGAGFVASIPDDRFWALTALFGGYILLESARDITVAALQYRREALEYKEALITASTKVGGTD